MTPFLPALAHGTGGTPPVGGHAPAVRRAAFPGLSPVSKAAHLGPLLACAALLAGCVASADLGRSPQVPRPSVRAVPASDRAPGLRDIVPPAPARDTPVVIRDDKGGNVLQALSRRARLESSGRPVEIRGYCRSACTVYVTLPNACLAPDATIGFHAPRVPGTRIIPPLVDRMMAATYRGGILARWNADWRHKLTMTRISARDYVALDPRTRLCRR